MAVCKIIPIKQSKGISQNLKYISNEEKVVSVKRDEGLLAEWKEANDPGSEKILTPMDFRTVLAYMANDEKTYHAEDAQKKYISGYMCNPETAVQEFLEVKEQNLGQHGKTLSDETGNWAFHIIQSFPENLKISDDEVHQCGRELCEKLGLYQAVICSHVHPVIDDENEVTGKCKHNHILINSHIHPSKLDPQHMDVFKYHNCRETYLQLQKWNDEISIAHGLPIIRNPELGKGYSWFKSQKENEGESWTKQVAIDIKKTMRFCSNWEEYKKQMTEQGYFIRKAGKTITYYAPEHSETRKQQIREQRLGKECTKKELERYWETMRKAKTNKALYASNESEIALIKDLVNQYDISLFAEVVWSRKEDNGKPYILDIPIVNQRRKMAEETIHTYFEADKTYNLCTSDNMPVAQVTGQDLFDYYEQERKERERRKNRNDYHVDLDEYYLDSTKINFKTKRPYTVSRWDESGRRRSTIELICMMSITVIKAEHTSKETPPVIRIQGTDGQFIRAKKDWKLQNMYNTMKLADEMHVESAAEVEQRLDRAGKEVARLRKQAKHLTEQYNQMTTIHDNLLAMESVEEICEEIYNMTNMEAKAAAESAHAAELAKYRTAKRYLHTKNINNEDQIADFVRRFQSTGNHLREVQDSLDTANQEYRNLKRIDYNLAMAQNNYYCYGPAHEMFAKQMANQKND